MTQSEGGTLGLLRVMRWSARRLPDAITTPLLWVISLIYSLNPARPANVASRRYLTRVLGRRPGFRDLHRHALTFAHVTFDRVSLLGAGVEGFRVEATGQHLIERLHREGRGGVLLGAHFGSFEIMRAFERTLPDLSIRYLMFAGNAQKSSALLQELNPEVAARVIPLTHGPDAMIATLEALQAGEFVAFLGDRVPNLASRGIAEVPFLGQPINVPTSPYHAALIAKVPLILCFGPRLGQRHYAVEFQQLFDETPVPRSMRDAFVDAHARNYIRALEGLCRTHPYNWFNFFDIWADDTRHPDTDQPRGMRRTDAGNASAGIERSVARN